MSEENIETLRSVIAAFRSRDWERIRELLDPGFEYHTSDQFPEGASVYTGPDAMMRVRAFLDEAWAQADIDLEDAIPVGDAVLATLCGRMQVERTGNVLPDYIFFQVWTFRDHRPISARNFQDRAGALEAVGLQT